MDGKKQYLTLLLSVLLVTNSMGVAVNADIISKNNVDVSYKSENIDSEGDASNGVDAFIERCYKIALGRDSDPEGLEGWKNLLLTNKACGVSLAFGFVYSPEFQNSNYPDDIYVDKMYNMLLGREADIEGKEYWVNNLQNGMDREDIFLGFANSQEFFDLCDSYGIVAGTYIKGAGMEKTANINGFVTRLYSICLGRRGDLSGQASWVNGLYNGSITGIEMATGFFFSEEYIDRVNSYGEAISNYYSAFLDRSGSEEEISSWLSQISYMSMNEIFARFANSEEFNNICSLYGIERGSIEITPTDSDSQTREHGNIEDLKSLYELEDEIGNRYGFIINIADEVPDDIRSAHDMEPCYDYDILYKALLSLDENFSIYPDSVFKLLNAGGMLKFNIYLVGSSEDIGGFTDSANYICYDADLISGNVAIIHHELSHCIEANVHSYIDTFEKEWMALNPEGFAYIGDYDEYFELPFDSYDSYNSDYFVDLYSTSFMTEDCARIFERAMWYYLYGENIHIDLPAPLEGKMTLYFGYIRDVLEFTDSDYSTGEIYPWEYIIYN